MDETSDLVRLAAGRLIADLVPGIGGSMAAFRHDDADLMRPLSEADRTSRNVLGVAMFPMVPYANRITQNRYDFDGRTYVFAANNPPEPFNVHGTGWHKPWSVDRQGQDQVSISVSVTAPDSPYHYRATQLFQMDPAGLTVTVNVTNTAKEAMPFGFGLHPWFIRDPDVTLQFAARTFYLEEPGNVSGDPVSLMPELDFAVARSLPDRWRNNDYGGWDGVAALRFPSRGLGLRMIADPIFRHLMVYSDPAKPYFCVEPQTNASGAFNRRDGFT
ncbi:MAG: aldose 1-epimerase, partial [Alphaproteobacteria bacterium]